MPRTPFVVVFFLVATGCEADRGSLVVQLLTDLAAGTEFDRVEVELSTQSSGSAERQMRERDIASTRDAQSGIEVATFDELTPGSWLVSARLFLGTTPLGEGGLLVATSAGAQVASVVVTANCRDTVCAGEDFAEVCRDGECVDARCAPDALEFCEGGVFVCETEADCDGAGPACVRGTCLAGTCGTVLDDGQCGVGICDRREGCVRDDLDAPRLRSPTNGFATGSALVPTSAAIAEHPLRPLFRWEPVAAAEEYQIQLDESCGVEAFRTCRFDSPEIDERVGPTLRPGASALEYRPDEPLLVSTAVPVGSRYAWRIRACAQSACGLWSDVRYLDVGRAHGDFNGDGYPDVAVGAHKQEAPEIDEGAVFVFHGGSGALDPTVERNYDNPLDDENGRFGTALAVADLNADGFSDLVVGAMLQSNSETEEGSAYVFYGSADGLSMEPDVALDNPDDDALAVFGLACSSPGDLDGDGYADLLIGARFQAEAGAIFVYRGSAIGVASTPDLTRVNPTTQTDAEFGFSAAGAGDLNGDGHVDIVVGAPFADDTEDGEGRAYIYFGGADTISSEPAITLANPSPQPSRSSAWALASAI